VAWRNIDLDLWWGRRSEEATTPPVDTEVSGQHLRNRLPETRVRFAAQQVVDVLRVIDREATRAERTVPNTEEREILASMFSAAVHEFQAIDRRISATERVRCVAAAHEVLHPWLLRSGYWSRSYLKPHGYAGDFRTLEWIYDLEQDACADPTKPVVVNLLDYLYRTLHSVRAVWHGRRWYAQLVGEVLETSRSGRPVRILDIACGGSRYVRDAIGTKTEESSVELTFVDEDPAALAFIRDWLPVHLRTSTRLIRGRACDVRELVLDGPSDRLGGFDLVISTGLCDYRPHAAGKLILAMTWLARPGGLVAISNCAPEDASRVVKDWLLEWPVVYRRVSELRDLVPDGHSVGFDRSPDGGLIHALVSVPAGEIRRSRAARAPDSTNPAVGTSSFDTPISDNTAKERNARTGIQHSLTQRWDD